MQEPHDFGDSGATPTGKRSGIRFAVVGLTTIMAVMLYLDRICFAFMERYIKEDVGLTDTQAGWLISAFFWSYALGQVPSGWLSDRFGPRWMLAVYILFFSLFTGLIGVAGSFGMILLFRLIYGLAQAGAYPTSAGLISKWVPFSGRGTASGIVSTGGRIGGVAAPILTAYLIVAFVPLQSPTSLEVGDILDGNQCCRDLVQEKKTPASQLASRLREEMSEETRDIVTNGSRDDAEKLTTAEKEPLRDLLNAAMEKPTLADTVDLDNLNMPAEARRLLAIPTEDATLEQVKRRNRLLLESAFPGSVRKLYVRGWRPTIILYGAVGIVVAFLFWLVVRDRPESHPWCNAGERAWIAGDQSAPGGSPHGKVDKLPFMLMVRNRSLWFSSLSQFGTNFGWVFITTLFPRYLADVHGVPVITRGYMTGIPILVGMLGMLFGGWLTDRLTSVVGLFWSRCLPMSTTRFVAMAAFIACILCDAPWPATIALSVVALATDLGTPAVWAFKQDIGGKHVGSVLGWGNMWGNFGAALSPVVLNAVIANAGWGWMFAVCAFAFLFSGVTAFGVDPRIPIEKAVKNTLENGGTPRGERT